MKNGWDGYLQSRSANLRSTIKRRNKSFAAAGGTLEVISSPENIEQAITATPLTPDELDLLALALWEANGERPTVYESGKAVADDVLEWWKQVAASAWGFINGMEAMQ